MYQFDWYRTFRQCNATMCPIWISWCGWIFSVSQSKIDNSWFGKRMYGYSRKWIVEIGPKQCLSFTERTKKETPKRIVNNNNRDAKYPSKECFHMSPEDCAHVDVVRFCRNSEQLWNPFDYTNFVIGDIQRAIGTGLDLNNNEMYNIPPLLHDIPPCGYVSKASNLCFKTKPMLVRLMDIIQPFTFYHSWIVMSFCWSDEQKRIWNRSFGYCKNFEELTLLNIRIIHF